MGNFVQDCEREWILEAINHLKHRKARPDLSRISLRMKRKHQINFAQTKQLLESLIESGIVVKAVYKNNTSYRDVSKWKKGKLGGHIQNSNKMLKRFVRAIEAKELGRPKGTGVSCEEIEDFLRSQGEEKCFLSGAALLGALEKEVSTGFLRVVYSGSTLKFIINEDKDHLLQILKQTDDEDLDVDLDVEIEHNNDETHTSNIVETDLKGFKDKIIEAVRETGHLNPNGSSASSIKLYLAEKHCLKHEEFCVDKLLEHFVFKKVLKRIDEFYSISDNVPSNNPTVPGRFETQEIDPIPSSQNSVVSTLSPSSNRPNDHFDEEEEQQVKILQLQGLSLVPKSSTLKDNAAKPSHLQILPNFSSDAVDNVKDTVYLGPSRPPSKRKRIVKDHGPDFEIEMPTKAKGKGQDTKDSVYPTPGNSPASERSECTLTDSLKNPVAKKKRGRPKKIKDEPSENTSRPATPSESLHAFPESTNQDEDSRSSSPSLQDVSVWSSEQVADYFRDRGFADEAQSMLDHDMDGSALALLKRSDIVGPPLGGILQVKKLGTALKLFRDIRDLLYQGHSSNYVDPYEERPFSRF